MRIPSGKIDQLIYFVAVNSTDLKTRLTGLTTFTVYRSRNGGVAAVYTTPTVAELSAANMPGVYSLTVDEDTTLGASSDSEEYCVHITQASMAPVTRTVELYRRDTTTGTTLDVTATGAAGIDWGNVENKATANALTATSIITTQQVDVNTIKTNPVVNAGTVTFPTTATLASTTNITAGTITTTTNLTTNNDKTGYGLSAAAVQAVWDALTTALTAVGSIGKRIVDNLDAAISSRLATAGYTAPTNLTAAQIATGLWTDTTAGDFTVALSVGKSVMNGVALGTGLTINAYTGDTPQTGDSFARIGLAGAGLTNIDLPNQTMDIVGNITGNLSGTVGSVTGATGSVTGSVGSVAAGVTVTTNNDKSGYLLGATGSLALTESYAADGVAPTLGQILYQIHSAVTEFAIVGTTLTCKQLDGVTTAMTFTLSDAANPTSRTRAT